MKYLLWDTMQLSWTTVEEAGLQKSRSRVETEMRLLGWVGKSNGWINKGEVSGLVKDQVRGLATLTRQGDALEPQNHGRVGERPCQWENYATGTRRTFRQRRDVQGSGGSKEPQVLRYFYFMSSCCRASTSVSHLLAFSFPLQCSDPLEQGSPTFLTPGTGAPMRV